MHTLALTIAYDGTDWVGSQRQTRYPSIQGVLESALETVMQHPVELALAGRTDAGVHALGQVASFATDNPIPLERIPWVVNKVLPASIRVRKVVEREPGFHARFSARNRRYWYLLQETRWPDPVRGRFCWQLTRSLQVDAMQAALQPLLGRHDFAAFQHGGYVQKSTVRTMLRASVHRRGHGIIIDVQANAFLHQMVRLLVANLVQIGSRERPVDWLEELLHTRNRHLAGKVAPPCGLFLMRIGYPEQMITPPGGSVLEC